MKTTQLIFLGCLSLAVTLAKAKDLGSQLLDIPENVQADATDLGKQTKSELNENLTDVSEDLNKIIPSVDQLTNKSDPVKLGEKIENITDPAKRKNLYAELLTAIDANRGTLAGKFYEAAYFSAIDEEKAGKLWNGELKRATARVMKLGSKIVTTTDEDIGGAFQSARKMVQLDPLGIALRRGDAVLLTVISDALKNLGKISDLVYDTAGNVVGISRVVTGRIQGIPVVGEIKSNVDNLVDEGLQRGKFLIGSFAENGAKALATLAEDSAKKADEKEAAFKEYVAKPTSLSV